MDEMRGVDPREAARHRLELKAGLALHWLVYVAVNVALMVAAGGLAGSEWRVAGWGIGLAVHTGYVVLQISGVKDRLVDSELARMHRP